MRLKRRPQRPVRIEMVPIIDTVFLLLVFFTYAMLSMVVPRGLRVRLPEVRGSETVGSEPLNVTIARSGAIYLNKEPIAPGDLPRRVAEELKRAPDRWVLVQGDKGAPLGTALDVLGRLREAGFDAVTFRVAPVGGEQETERRE